MSTADDEYALAEKLLRTLHMSVPDRATLSGGRMRFSTLVTAAEQGRQDRPAVLPAVQRWLATGECPPRHVAIRLLVKPGGPLQANLALDFQGFAVSLTILIQQFDRVQEVSREFQARQRLRERKGISTGTLNGSTS